ncbi:MFS transporter [Bifidobacterium dolichotidis]|uniref:MFS transporter n=1 Tax=Bifidobacterium dolichotidis TaxID=2306976 RepID=A0A430FKR2_9BIFI|nr:MFS transporter [Bifidobacterium dolichotidis]RSX53342.1 MFS transporter [Bifidobacterium dolichotidis]
MAQTSSTVATKSSRTRRSSTVLLIVLLLANTLASIDQSMMNIALDATAEQFHVELADANWTVLGFSIIAGTVIMSGAAILARFGLRRVMMAGFIISAVGSLLGLFAVNFGLLLAARFLQALTTGLFFPVVSAAILLIAPAGKKATLLAINSGIIGVGLAISPIITGVLITYVSLRSMFLVPLVLSILLIVIGPFTLYDIEQRANRPIDALSVISGFLGLFAFMHGLNIVTKTVWPGVIFMAIGTAVLAFFFYRQLHIAHPLLHIEPLKHAEFDMGEAVSLIGFMSSLFMSLLAPLYLEGTAGFTPFIAGCCLVVPILMYAGSSFLAGHIEDKFGIWPLVPGGLLCIIAGLIGLVFAAPIRSVPVFLICCAVTYFGVGFVFAPMKSRILQIVPPKLGSHAASIHSTFVQVVTSIASALFVGMLSSDSLRLMHAGVSKADAYAEGFQHTLYIDLGVACVGFALALFLIYRMHRKNQLKN